MTTQTRRTPAASFRLPGDTLRQIAELTDLLGMTKTAVLSRAVDRLYQEAKAMNTAKARKIAIKAIESADGEGQPVADATLVGKDDNGYWVTDNGEEVNGLTKEQAIDIIVENLTA